MKKPMTFAISFFVGLLIVSSSFAKESSKTGELNMTIDQNKERFGSGGFGKIISGFTHDFW